MMTWPQMANDRLTLQDKMWSGGWKIERDLFSMTAENATALIYVSYLQLEALATRGQH
jgi:hypothetical protein